MRVLTSSIPSINDSKEDDSAFGTFDCKKTDAAVTRDFLKLSSKRHNLCNSVRTTSDCTYATSKVETFRVRSCNDSRSTLLFAELLGNNINIIISE